MALSTELAAVNTAAIAYFTAIEALIVSLATGDEVQFVASDLGDSAIGYNHERANNDTAVSTTFDRRYHHPVTDDGEFPIQIPMGNDGSLVPLVWFVTNTADDLS